MNPRSRPSEAPHILPFEEWLKTRYPKKTFSQTVLKAIGVLDLAYLLYRLNVKPTTAPALAKVTSKAMMKKSTQKRPFAAAERATKAIEEVEAIKDGKEIEAIKAIEEIKDSKEVKPTTPAMVLRGPGEKKEHEKNDLKLEFHKTPKPKKVAQKKVHKPVIEAVPEVIPMPEPEPLILEQTEPEPMPEKKKATTVNSSALIWIDDQILEDEDILRTRVRLGIDSIPVSFETRDIDDERETRLTVGERSYVIMLVSPVLNLSQMLQVARVTNGELYVLGRMALGAISGEGYVTADETTRVIRALHAANGQAVDMDITYFSKDHTTRNRTTATVRIRFEPVR